MEDMNREFKQLRRSDSLITMDSMTHEIKQPRRSDSLITMDGMTHKFEHFSQSPSYGDIDPAYCENRAPTVNQPSRQEQKRAKRMARKILGGGLFQAPTVAMILEMQGSEMEPEEWLAIRDALLRDERAWSDLRRLCSELPQPQRIKMVVSEKTEVEDEKQ